MAYFTQCTHCHTRFRVTDAHLEAHNGQVRCGKCQKVFDARSTLMPEQSPPVVDKPAVKPIAPMPEPPATHLADEAEHLQQVLASSRVPDKAQEMTRSVIGEDHERENLPSDDEIDQSNQEFNLDLPDFDAKPAPPPLPEGLPKEVAQSLAKAVNQRIAQTQAIAPDVQPPTPATPPAAPIEQAPNTDAVSEVVSVGVEPTPAHLEQTSTLAAEHPKEEASKPTPIMPPAIESFESLTATPPDTTPVPHETRAALEAVMMNKKYEHREPEALNTAPPKSPANFAESYASALNASETFSARDDDEELTMSLSSNKVEEDTHDEHENIDTPPTATPTHKPKFIGLAVAASVLLLFQVLFFFRTELSSEVPGARPVFESTCAALGCTVPYAKKGELLRTEWSELTYVPDHPNLVQFSATLRNLAQYPMAFPYLELSLKDSDDIIIAKKVFAPEDYLMREVFSQGKFDANSEVKVSLPMDLGTLKSAGYSLIWFYP